jgi:hypothetical protein
MKVTEEKLSEELYVNMSYERLKAGFHAFEKKNYICK